LVTAMVLLFKGFCSAWVTPASCMDLARCKDVCDDIIEEGTPQQANCYKQCESAHEKQCCDDAIEQCYNGIWDVECLAHIDPDCMPVS
jgi:hypothetical protein